MTNYQAAAPEMGQALTKPQKRKKVGRKIFATIVGSQFHWLLPHLFSGSSQKGHSNL
jgi:hypothetical protein